jgi:uncharacterized membrane-anchored protein
MRHLITLGFAILAIAAYAVGLEYGAGALFLAGGICEIIAAKRMRRKTQVL